MCRIHSFLQWACTKTPCVTPTSDNKSTQCLWMNMCVCVWVIEWLSSTSVLIVPVLVSCEEESSCTALILTGKRCEHKCSAAAAAEQPTTCQKCRVTPRAATWPRNAHTGLRCVQVFFPLADCGQLALYSGGKRVRKEWWQGVSSNYGASLWKVSFNCHLSNPWNTTNHVPTSVENCYCNSTWNSTNQFKVYANHF